MGLGSAIKNFGRNLHEVGKGGQYLGAALKGAAIWGGVSGVTEWASGGSFFQGLKGGLVTGAVGGTAMRGAKVSVMGKNWEKATWGDVGKTLKGSSKSLQSLLNTEKYANLAAAANGLNKP